MFAPDPPVDGVPEAHDAHDAPGAANAPPAVAPMTGRIAVGMVIVSGPTPALSFTSAETRLVTAQMQNGLTWLGTQSAAARITWVHEINLLTINAPAPAPGANYQALETAFRDPALAQMGHPAGTAGVAAAVRDLCTRKSCATGMIVIFTKYPTGHFAYAWPNDAYLVMTYANDGWGPNRIDRVFAHETCHLFGAPDEYAASGCNCGGVWGTSKGANANCQNCPGQTTPNCIMRKNEWAMCSYTRGHIGFPD